MCNAGVDEHSPVSVILESIRCLVNRPAVRDTAMLGPTLTVTVHKGSRTKTYTIFVDYGMGFYGRRVRLCLLRSTRWGSDKWSTVHVPSVDLWRFEDSANWSDVHYPLLHNSLHVPHCLHEPTATVSISATPSPGVIGVP